MPTNFFLETEAPAIFFPELEVPANFSRVPANFLQHFLQQYLLLLYANFQQQYFLPGFQPLERTDHILQKFPQQYFLQHVQPQ